jgi:mRNA interferase MazF
VVIVQGDAFNASRISTTVVVPLTSNQRLAAASGNVALPTSATGLPKDSVANVSQIVAIDRDLLTERVGHLSDAYPRSTDGRDRPRSRPRLKWPLREFRRIRGATV